MKRMSRRMATCAGLLLATAGCNDQHGWWNLQSPEPAVAEAQPAEPTPIEPALVEAEDPHRQETIDQVLDFVARLDQTDADTNGSSEEQTETSVNIARQVAAIDAGSASPTPKSESAVNMPLEVGTHPAVDAETPEPAGPAPPALPVLEAVFIRHALADGTSNEPQASTPSRTTNSPLAASDPPRGTMNIDELLEVLGKRVRANPEDVTAQWELGLLQLAVGDEQAARDLPRGGAGEFSELLTRALETMMAVRAALEHPITQSEAALLAVSALHTTLRERGDLLIPTVALCTRVQTFGVYDEMADGALLPNRANRAIVYIEAANFFSERTPEGQYRTVLSNQLEVLTPQGQSLWQRQEPSIVDLSRQRRTDFFVAQLITLPDTLGAGEYVLKVTLQDELSGRSNQAIHRFSIGASSTSTSR
ncbi:MAG: hypothetical protein IID40_10045 [Planctomycetes bacterium]|nr:hypothetical protein [Planctomycetota bacterium]